MIVTLLGCSLRCGVDGACDAQEPDASGADTGVALGDVSLETRWVSCADPLWEYQFGVSAIPARATLDVSGPGLDADRWEEHHDLEITPGGHWQVERTLLVVDDVELQVPDVSSTFACADQPSMTWRVFLYDDADRRSCALFGADPAFLDAEGCVSF